MIHIATVHWQTDEWIDIQLTYLARFLNQPFRVYGFLNGISPKHYDKFYYICDEPIGDHGIKLNLLAQIICMQGKEDDIIIFLDGDAFPVAPINNFLNESLSKYPLTAVVRTENLGDRHPHPCFCATTIKFWIQVKGDWKVGYSWTDNTNQSVSDTGANLLYSLEKNKIDWLPLYRTNSISNHSLWHGVYHYLFYHHGAGFRPPAERIDVANGPIWLKYLWLSINKSRSLTAVLNQLWEKALQTQVVRKNQKAHDIVFNRIKNEKYFFSTFLSQQEIE